MSLDSSRRDYKALLHPEELRSGLLLASLYVLAYESFQAGVIDHLRTLHFRGIDESGWKIDEDAYRRDVLSRDKHPFRASLLWYHAYDAIDTNDLSSIERLRQTRNKLVHELWRLVGTEQLPSLLQDFGELIRIYRKIEVWRVLNFEIDGNPDLDGQEISAADVIPGPILFMQMLFDVALGDENKAWAYYKHLVATEEPPQSEPSAYTPAT